MKQVRLRCEICGRFVSFEDLKNKQAIHHMITPDSDLSSEEYETLCKKHYTREIPNL